MREKVKVLLILWLVMQCLCISMDGQAIKKWKGRYPRMNNNYPMAFMSFKGWLPPIPHFFVRMFPTHYYYKLKSIPTLDAKELTGKTKTGLLRIFARMMERGQMKDRFGYINKIQEMTGLSKQIEELLFNAQSDELADIYHVGAQLLQAYDQLELLNYYKGGNGVKRCFEKDLDQLLQQFLMINVLQSDHGSKLDAFTKIQATLSKLKGEVNYTINKLRYFQSYGNEPQSNYAFLTR